MAFLMPPPLPVVADFQVLLDASHRVTAALAGSGR
jgi:hypothetical protein